MAPVHSKIAPPGLLSMFAEAAHREERRINLIGARNEHDSRLKRAFGINTRQTSYKGPCGHTHFYNIGVNGDVAAHILDYCSKKVCSFASRPVPGKLFDHLKADIATIQALGRLYKKWDTAAAKAKKRADQVAKDIVVDQQEEAMCAVKTLRKKHPKAAKIVSRRPDTLSSSTTLSHTSNVESSNVDANVLRAREQQIQDDFAYAFSLAADNTTVEEDGNDSAPFRGSSPPHSEDDHPSKPPTSDDDPLPSSTAEVVSRVRTQERAKFRLGHIYPDPSFNPSAASSSKPTAIQSTTPSSSRIFKRRFEVIDDDEVSVSSSNKKAKGKGKGRAKPSIIDLTVDVIDLDSD